MIVTRATALLIGGALSVGACTQGGTTAAPPGDTATAAAVPFKEARLIVEINATDGDAGLQIFLDHEPWRSVAVYRPDGSKILDVTNTGVLRDFGLTELFSESSEPPFRELPLAEFKELFPEGEYRVTGVTVDGKSIESRVMLTHDFPAGPAILTPEEDAEVPAKDLVVSWEPAAEPRGIEIAGYQVLVVREGQAVRTFAVDLPASARRIRVPREFLEPGAEHKVEVLAIEANRNQTLTEVTFTVAG